MSTPEIQRVNVLGVPISAIRMNDALFWIDRWIRSGDQKYICVADVHAVMEGTRDPGLREIYCRAGLVTPDGMPLVWFCRNRGYPDVERVYGPDLLLAACERFQGNGTRHYFLGGSQGVPERLAGRLRALFPDLRIAGAFSPPFRPLTAAEDEELVMRINEAHPDILWVGLGNPKQEFWMADHLGRIEAPVMVGVGAAFDFHSGRVRQAPRWIQRSGFEWLFRLFQEPGRLWRRYLRSNPRFLALVLLQLLGKIKPPPCER